MLAVAVTFYALTTIAVYAGLTNQVSRRLIQTTWRDCGAANSYGESEVVFDFADFPGNSVGMYSTALRDHLVASGKTRVELEFEVVSDVWCVRGLRETRIGGLSDLSTVKRIGGYSQVSANEASPWGPKHWWCR